MHSEDDFRPASILPALVQAAAHFAMLGMSALLAIGAYLHDWTTVRLVIVAVLISYLAQLCFVWVEEANVTRRSIPLIINRIALGLWLIACLLVVAALYRSLSW